MSGAQLEGKLSPYWTYVRDYASCFKCGVMRPKAELRAVDGEMVCTDREWCERMRARPEVR